MCSTFDRADTDGMPRVLPAAVAGFVLARLLPRATCAAGQAPAPSAVATAVSGPVEKESGVQAAARSSPSRRVDFGRLAAALTVTATALYGIAYAYLLGFYSVWGLTPEAVGVAHEAVVTRVGLGAVLYFGFAAVSLPVLVTVVRKRPGRATVRLFATTVAVLVLAVASLVTVAVLPATAKPSVWLGALVFVSLLALPAAIAALIVLGVPVGLVSRVTRRLMPTKVVDQVGALALLLVPIVILGGSGYFYSLVVQLGSRDGARILSGRGHVPVTSLNFFSGADVRPGTVVWLGAAPSPFGSGTAPVLLLGSTGSTVVYFDLVTCAVLDLPATQTAFREETGSRPQSASVAPDAPRPVRCVRS